jgi:hypothetical protein
MRRGSRRRRERRATVVRERHARELAEEARHAIGVRRIDAHPDTLPELGARGLCGLAVVHADDAANHRAEEAERRAAGHRVGARDPDRGGLVAAAQAGKQLQPEAAFADAGRGRHDRGGSVTASS